MDSEKIGRVKALLENQFPGIEIDFTSEEPDWYRFRVGYSPPALFVDLQYELVVDNPADVVIDRLSGIDLVALMPSEGTARYRVYLNRIEEVED